MFQVSSNADADQSGGSDHSSLSRTLRYIRHHKLASLEFAGAFAFAGLLTGLGVAAANGPVTPARSTISHGSMQLHLSHDNSSNTQANDDSDNAAKQQPVPSSPPSTQSTSSHTSLNVTTSSDSTTGTSTKVMVNGKEVPVPENGVYQRTTTNSDGTASTVIIQNSSDNYSQTETDTGL